MNIDFNLIREKYTKGYKGFVEYYKKNNPDCTEVCYCDIEKFFDDNGVIIDVFSCFSLQGYKSIKYEIKNKKLELLYNMTYVNDLDKLQAKIQAIYKAFEIMEKEK